MKKILLALPLLLTTQNIHASFVSYSDLSYREVQRTGIFLERAFYDERVYSRGRKTELGDQTRVDMTVRYQFLESSYTSFRFVTDPLENRFGNKSSELEFVAGHRYQNFSLRVDAELDMNDNGGTSIGLDLDSRGTFISYEAGVGPGFIFYPFNFDSRVGRQFDSHDVTRIYFIDGSPSNVNNTQLGNEKIAEKTIPGLELNFRLAQMPSLKVYTGIGFATYLYPANESFDIQTNRLAERWERRETVGYKFGATYRSSDPKNLTLFNLQYSTHSKSEETGSLLSSAGTLNGRHFFGDLFIDGELTYSKAGKSPYRLNRGTQWFDKTTPFQPIYSDYFGQPQDWINQSGMGYALKIGHRVSGFLPYAFFRYQSKHFIFNGQESAHRLRTADESQSHGGLKRLGVGSIFQYGNFSVNPELEWLKSKNPVFGNSSDVREDRVLSSFRTEDFLLTLAVSYNFDGRPFRR